MSKPNWRDAPKWAKYLAQDKDGKWHWFQYKPVKSKHEWLCSSGDFLCAGEGIEWESSMERRQ